MPASAKTPTGTPMPMPALAPELRPACGAVEVDFGAPDEVVGVGFVVVVVVDDAKAFEGVAAAAAAAVAGVKTTG